MGTRVRVRDGIFGGVEGMVTELRQQRRVILSLATMHQCFSLEVEIGDLVVLDKPVATPELKTVKAEG